MNLPIEKIATIFFALSLLHSFSVSWFAKLAHRFEKGSVRESLFHLLGEIEVVFGLWAFLFVILWMISSGPTPAIDYIQKLNMTEPMFIFCIMILASTRPLVLAAQSAILWISDLVQKMTKLPKVLVQFYLLFTVGPLLGSLITEPAAITLVALLAFKMIDTADEKFLYPLLALLFVNISIGGGLTHFAAPPILVVAGTWGWGLRDVFVNLGEAVLLAVFVNTTVFTFIFKNRIKTQLNALTNDTKSVPFWITLVHLLFLASLVATAHYSKVFMGIFLIFIGFTTVTNRYQDQLKFKEGLLVGFFLGGLIVFGSFQKWWLEPILTSIGDTTLFFAATLLTGITDNAALTYLGSQVPNLAEASKWALVSGAITGGGLSILANAPNPAGFSILSSKFPGGSLNAGKLLVAAAPPTFITILSFLLLGNF